MSTESVQPTAKWRTYTGAEYGSVTEISCAVIANGQLIDADGNTIYEDEPEISAEIRRRGSRVYREHGYAKVPTFGCEHPATPGVLPEGSRRKLAASGKDEKGALPSDPLEDPEFLNARIKFWICPIDHPKRNGPNGFPLQTVEWVGDVARCLEPGCGRTSADAVKEVKG